MGFDTGFEIRITLSESTQKAFVKKVMDVDLEARLEETRASEGPENGKAKDTLLDEASEGVRGVFIAARLRDLPKGPSGKEVVQAFLAGGGSFERNGKALGEAVRNGAIAGADVKAAALAAQRGPRRPA